MLNEQLIGKGVNCLVYTNSFQVNSMQEDEDLSINHKIKRVQLKDDKVKELIQKVKERKIKGFVLEDGVLLKLRKGRNGRIFKQLVVPDELKQDIFKLCHDNFTCAHLGEKKTWINLSNRFHWPNAYQDTIKHVRTCEVCAKIKNPPANRAHLHPITDFEKPFDKVAVDILELTQTKSGNKYVVVFSDYLTRWVEAFPLKNQTAESIAKVLINEIITRH